jgi:hypothetical protein
MACVSWLVQSQRRDERARREGKTYGQDEGVMRGQPIDIRRREQERRARCDECKRLRFALDTQERVRTECLQGGPEEVVWPRAKEH